jgi:tetrahydromethanopterin S-methyltransferase subunit B|tara:strand:+ start:853 stop:1014 length:162 start_codon:yes stop_codon:yes gene_type:complete
MGYSGEEIDVLDVDDLDNNKVRLDMLPIADQIKRLEKKRDEMREKKKILCSQL